VLDAADAESDTASEAAIAPQAVWAALEIEVLIVVGPAALGAYVNTFAKLALVPKAHTP
jgi:hypothetical protein